MSMQGTHKARGKEWGLGHSSTGKKQVAVLLELTQGEHAGKCITWFGYFTDGAVDRTLDSLRYLGWEGDDFVHLTGLDANEVEIVITAETYEGKTRDRVQWINRPARLALREQMSPAAAAAFAASMRAKAIAHKQAHGPARTPGSRATPNTPAVSTHGAGLPDQFDGDDIPF